MPLKYLSETTLPTPPTPKYGAHLQFLIDIRVNESSWTKQPPKA